MRKLLFLVVAILISTYSFSADFYFKPTKATTTTSNTYNWSELDNWCNANGGPVNVILTNSDNVYFNVLYTNFSTSSVKVVVNNNYSVKNLLIDLSNKIINLVIG